MNPDLVVWLTGALVATSCSLLGVWLVLRRLSLMSDAISHSVLLGIVAAYWLSQGENFLLAGLLGAAGMGLITVLATELLSRSGLVKNDAAIGLVFPFFFSLAVIWVSVSFRNVHLDTDAVLMGEIAFTPFSTFTLGGIEIAQSLVVLGALSLLNLLFVGLFFKELKLSTFDAGLAATLGLMPGVLHYALMTLTSFTIVGAFEAVGAILVIAFIIIPPATAYLLTQRLTTLMGLAVGLGVLAATVGFALAIAFDASIAGMMATVALVFFVLAWLFSPTQGLVVQALRRKRQRLEVGTHLLLTHLAHHSDAVQEREVLEEFGWPPGFLALTRQQALKAHWITLEGSSMRLTPLGRQQAHTPFL